MNYISSWRDGDPISAVFLCKAKNSALTKAGKTYYNVTLQDKTGTADGKIWDLSSGIDHFEAMQYVKVDGEVKTYQNNLQLTIRRLRLARRGEYNPADYIPCSPYPIEDMYRELLSYVHSVQNTKLRALLESFFLNDEAFIQRFKTHSAAKTVHHSFSGGLLQHTLRVTQLCDDYCRKYPLLNRDLLLAGAMLHDIGKLEELSDFPQNDYTDVGQLLGHIVIGAQMVAERCDTIPDFPEVTKNELCHMILAHHGEFEFGSPKKPALLEALALHYADDTDAKMQTMSELLSDGASGGWLGFQKLLDTNIRRTETKQ